MPASFAVGYDDLLLSGGVQFAGRRAGEAAGDFGGGVVGVGDFQLHACGVESFAHCVGLLGGLFRDGDGRNSFIHRDVKACGLAAVTHDDLLLTRCGQLARGGIGEAARDFLCSAVVIGCFENHASRGDGFSNGVGLFCRHGFDGYGGNGRTGGIVVYGDVVFAETIKIAILIR